MSRLAFASALTKILPMPTPKQGYRCADGELVPGTTTIIGRFKESGGLVQWAYKRGREDGDRSARGLSAPRHLHDTVQAAADAGTIAHDLVERHLRANGDDPAVSMSALMDEFKAGEDVVRNACAAYRAFATWEKQSRIKIIETEMQLVSERYRFGGTPDAIGQIDNAYYLLDWKTSNAVYTDMLIQLAAYGHLLKECRGIEVAGYHLCRFAKEHGDFAHHFYPDLSDAFEQFKDFRKCFDRDKALKKRAA